jgi:catechol 2,3-dioxygenase-like lactoylglutathione lyase family enzyme
MRASGSPDPHPVLAVRDLDRSGVWYREVLGCELYDPDPGNWRFCRAGEVIFMLGRCPDVPPASELGDHSYVAYLLGQPIRSAGRP